MALIAPEENEICELTAGPDASTFPFLKGKGRGLGRIL